MEVKDSFLIVGCGYVGTRFAQHVQQRGHPVVGTTRSSDKANQLKSLNIKPLLLDINTAKGFGEINSPDYILLSVAPSESTPQGYQSVYESGIHRLMTYLHFHPPKKGLIYTSSIGVYEIKSGDWVDETLPLEPMTPRVHSLLTAEKSIKMALPGAMIYRLGGIYGLERNRMKAVKERTFSEESLKSFANMIHIDDVVESLFFLFDKGKPGETYNGVDEQPVLRKEVFSWIAGELGISLKLTQEGTSPSGRSDQNKRCSNKKLMSLGYKFKHPTYRDGYKEIINEQ